MTRTAMISTANHYLKDLAMFDDRILSTLGWTEEDVDAFRKLDGVSAAEGARSADVLCVGEDGSDMVLKAHSLTQQVNRLSLQAGRLPEKADECVVDAWRYDESALGSVIRLSDNNSADTMDTFASREYTVVGVAASPMYINYERGGTALGNGTVAAFVYLLPEGFALDYYTEIDVTLTGADGRIYTAAYDDAVEAMEQPLKELAAQRRSCGMTLSAVRHRKSWRMPSSSWTMPGSSWKRAGRNTTTALPSTRTDRHPMWRAPVSTGMGWQNTTVAGRPMRRPGRTMKTA